MITYTLRLLALVLLFIIILYPTIPYPKLFKNASIQLYLALVAMIILLIFDNVTGFILSLCLLVLYFKLYNDELKQKKAISNDNKHEKLENMSNDKPICSLDKPCKIQNEPKEDNNNKILNTQIPFISEEHLLAAQNNIFDEENYNNEILGVAEGLYNEKVYGTQGLNKNHIHIQGYDTYDSYIGSLNYEIYQ